MGNALRVVASNLIGAAVSLAQLLLGLLAIVFFAYSVLWLIGNPLGFDVPPAP